MGWGDAWAGLSQQAFAATVDTLQQREQRKYQTQRDEIARKAEEAQRKQREAYESKMLEKRAALDRAGRQEDFKMRKGLAQQEQSFRAQDSAADRAIRERQLQQNEAYNQEQLGLQSRGLDLRAQEMEMTANRPAAVSQRAGTDVTAARRMFSDLTKPDRDGKRMSQEQAAGEVATVYGGDVFAAAFPGLADQRNQAAQSVGRIATGVEDLLDKYLSRTR